MEDEPGQARDQPTALQPQKEPGILPSHPVTETLPQPFTPPQRLEDSFEQLAGHMNQTVQSP